MRVLLLSTTTGYQLRAFGEAAERLGIELMFATDRCHSLDDPWQDAAVPVRFHDEAASVHAIVAASATRPIDGVIAVGDRPVVLAARMAAVLGLPGNPPDAVRASANKRQMRERFARAGLRAPWYVHLRTSTDLAAVAQHVRYPAVVKPLGLSGSRGVIRADTPEELAHAVQRVYALLARKDIREMRLGLEGEILIEAFVAGREYAVEGVLTNGVFQCFAIFDKPDPLNGPFFEETVYVTPSAQPPGVQGAVVAEVKRAIRALNLQHGPIHAECRLASEGIVILEVAARPIGGLCSRVLKFRTPTAPAGCATVSLEEVLLRHAIGEDVSQFKREPSAAAVMMIPIPERGVLKRVSGEDTARTVPHVEDVRITAKIDQLVEPLPEAASYLGFIFARAAERDAAEIAVRVAHRCLTFAIDPPFDVETVTSAPAARGT